MPILFTAYQTIQEILLLIFYPLSSITSSLYPDAVGLDEKTEVILVIRFFNKNPLHLLWKWYLEKKGFHVALLFFPIHKGSFDQSAQELKSHIETYNLQKIVLVGLSSGAITCLVYLQQYNGWKRVKQFISVGTPFYGMPIVQLLAVIPSIHEVLPNSFFVKSLLKETVKNPTKILCLSAWFDEIVPRWSSALIGINHKVINTIGHNNLHSASKQTYDTIIESVST